MLADTGVGVRVHHRALRGADADLRGRAAADADRPAGLDRGGTGRRRRLTSAERTPTAAADAAGLATATPGQMVYLGAGVYTTSAPLVVPPGVTLLGSHGGRGVCGQARNNGNPYSWRFS